jgi:NAD(P)-dependent dehydrogenase (short-subunit alcohol dehydrogenase family)
MNQETDKQALMTSTFTADVSGRNALVTGGANGLGEASAMALASCGANVAIIDRDQENGKRVADAIAALGRKSLFIELDMMATDDIEAAVNKAAAALGGLDTLVNNVGGGRPTAFLQQSKNSIQRHITLNLVTALFTTQAAGPHMIKAGRGALINVASTEALRAAPDFAVYAACKAGMVSFTKTMALELAPHNIRSFALAPDMIATPGLEPLLRAANPEQQAARDRYIPLGRMGSQEEFGKIVAFLASDMAGYLNGITVPVDAGATAAAGWYRNPDNNWCLYHS